MNERIKQLGEQAGLKINYWKTNPPTPMQILAEYEQVEKFAELIVQECCFMIEDNVMYMWKPLSNLIKEHFGVKNDTR